MPRVRQRQPIVRKRRRQTRAERELEREAQERFKREVLLLDRHRCIGSTVFASQHRCTGPLEAHHCVKAQWIRTHISSLGLSEEEIIGWLWTPDNGATMCHGLHEGHTNRSHVVPLEWLPNRVTDWARANDVFHLLTREHPPFDGA